MPCFLGPSGHVEPNPIVPAQPADTNRNLQAWLLEPKLSRSRDSLKQWQQELRLLRSLNQISL